MAIGALDDVGEELFTDYVRRNLGKDPTNDPIIEVRRSDVNRDGMIGMLGLMAVIAAYEYNLP